MLYLLTCDVDHYAVYLRIAMKGDAFMHLLSGVVKTICSCLATEQHKSKHTTYSFLWLPSVWWLVNGACFKKSSVLKCDSRAFLLVLHFSHHIFNKQLRDTGSRFVFISLFFKNRMCSVLCIKRHTCTQSKARTRYGVVMESTVGKWKGCVITCSV